MKNLFSAIVLAFLWVSFAFGQTLTYQGVMLKPGDVINFHEGNVVRYSGKLVSYGHSAMYLGKNPNTGKQCFLDFNIDNKGRRIPSEQEFLTTNARHHVSFDVFRMKDCSQLNQGRLLEAARQIVQKNYNLGGHTKNRENCASAIAYALSKATGKRITLQSPDDFLKDNFGRHPQLKGKSINIQAALRETRASASIQPKGSNKPKGFDKPKVSGKSKGSSKSKGRCPPGYYYCSRGC